MNPLTENDIRSSFVNASRRERSQATLPDLDTLDWDSLDYLGWRDAKRPLNAYVVVEVAGTPTGLLLRTAPRVEGRRAGLCSWCQDVVVGVDVSMYVTKRAGASGRRGNTVGTMICTNLLCSQNVRRTPTASEVGSDDPGDRQRYIERRIDGLRERSEKFVAQVMEQ
ncbi:FBP domain-containing protein [Luteipulveratus halotolerans]|uniref:Translation elongation factor n=1 Tax=Luteipulveratus halotolerans TaxID=1631356 RepID=A0A0L6CK49_9MICO|nr:FBP domain-containing protein [Luteipulveratus halotolerans]KNX37980.1 translation elongation factor [Luteipulveratus halotolerans]